MATPSPFSVDLDTLDPVRAPGPACPPAPPSPFACDEDPAQALLNPTKKQRDHAKRMAKEMEKRRKEIRARREKVRADQAEALREAAAQMERDAMSEQYADVEAWGMF